MSQPTEPTEPPGSGPPSIDLPVDEAAGGPGPTTASTNPAREPGEVGRRRLERPPSARLAATAPSAEVVATSVGSPGRAVAMGIVGAAIGVVVFLILAIGFSYSAGLVVVAVFMGRFVGLFVRAGAAGTLSSPARTLVAIVIFLVALAAAVVVTWLWAGAEGGDLGFGEYLNEVYGVPIVALEFMLGTLMAWWSAR